MAIGSCRHEFVEDTRDENKERCIHCNWVQERKRKPKFSELRNQWIFPAEIKEPE